MSRSGSTTRDRTARARRARGVQRPALDRHGSQRRATPSRPAASVTPIARRRRRPRGFGPRLLQLAGVAVAVAVVAWLLLAGPVLAVRAVHVDGLVSLPADQVREAAGIASGTPLLRVDLDTAEQRVSGLPPVASVELTRDWPGSVVITVVERVPVAVVGAAGRRSLIDADGVLFDMVTGAPPDGVVPLDVAAPGPEDPATRAGIAAIAAIPAEVREQVSHAAARSPEDIVLTLADGTVVHWGDARESRAKSAALVGLIQQVRSGALDPAGTIDVSTPDAVVLR